MIHEFHLRNIGKEKANVSKKNVTFFPYANLHYSKKKEKNIIVYQEIDNFSQFFILFMLGSLIIKLLTDEKPCCSSNIF